MDEQRYYSSNRRLPDGDEMIHITRLLAYTMISFFTLAIALFMLVATIEGVVLMTGFTHATIVAYILGLSIVVAITATIEAHKND